MYNRYRILLSSTIIFLLSVLPALLGLFSFYRYETVSILLRTRHHISDFFFASIWQTTLIDPKHMLSYEYYRPGEYIVWGISYLIAGDNPLLYQLFQTIIYGLIAVGLYLVGRFFSGEFAGWIAALTYAYLEANVVLSWWSATLDGFFGMLCLVAGLVLFLYMPFCTGISIVLSTICIGLAIFTKETHILLWIIFPMFILMAPDLKSRAHWIIAGATLGLIFLKLFLQNQAGAAPGEHIVASVFDIDLQLALQNYIDYGRLLLYGHNILLIFLCLIRPDARTSSNKLTGLLTAVLLLFFAARVMNTIWLLDIAILIYLAYYLFRARYFERIWIVWALAGLSLVILYDIRIVGGIMNRRVLEPSMGFSLFVGCALAFYPTYIKHRWKALSLQSIQNGLSQIRKISQMVWRHADTICLVLILLIGFRQEINKSGILREWRYWTAEGKILRTTLYTLNDTLPFGAILVADAIPGLQKGEQINDALVFMFNRDDIKIFTSEEVTSDNQKRFDPSVVSLFALTTEQENKLSSAFSLSLINTLTDPENLGSTLYLYRLYALP